MKKTLTTTLLAILMCICVAFGFAGLGAITVSAADDLTVTIDTNESVTLTDGDGDGYYDINTADDLYAFAALVNSGSTDINGELTANITVNTGVLKDDGTLNGDGSGFRAWATIGNYDIHYIGIFDGNNYTVSGLYFNDGNASDVGLFGYVGEKGKVQNVGIVVSYFCGTYNVGGVVGHNNGTVTNCYNTGTVIGVIAVGGVVGLNERGTVANCYNTGTVSGSGNSVGGVVGLLSNDGTVTNCYNTGTVTGNGDSVGGVVGRIGNGTVTNCYYLTGCAADSSETTQYGIGNETQGSFTEDVKKSTAGYSDFSSGAVAYLLGQGCTVGEGDDAITYSGEVWGQNIDNGNTKENHPVLICTPKVRHFWRCIFLWEKQEERIEDTRQNSKCVLQ